MRYHITPYLLFCTRKCNRFLLQTLLLLCISNQVLQAQTCTVNAGVPFAMCQDAGTEWTLYGNTNTPAGGSVPIIWTVISEPAGSSVSITSPNAEETTVTNVTEIGTYTFNISGTCPDGSGTPIDQVVYILEEPIPSPSLPDSVRFCKTGSICIVNPSPTINYGWVTTEWDNDFEYGTEFFENGTCFDLSVRQFHPGGEGKVILYSSRGSCTRIDTVDVFIANDEPADAGPDVYICGDSWCKKPVIFQNLNPDDYRFMTYGGVMSWQQLSGPVASTITYNPTYDRQASGYVCFEGLDPGTYEFELTFTHNDPCMGVTKDSFFLYSAASSPDCQNLTGNAWFYGDCDDLTEEWVIDLKNYGIEPSELLPGDSIVWHWEGTDCDTRAVPPVNSYIVTVDNAGICEDCELHVTYKCSEGGGCDDGIYFKFFDFEVECEGNDKYLCSPDGNPVAFGSSSQLFSCDGCNLNSFSKYFEVINSPHWAAGTQLSSISGSFPFSLGVHEFNYHYNNRNDYYSLFPPYRGFCEEVFPFNVIVQGIASSANAGTDVALPCGADATILSGSNPNLPTPTGATVYWSFQSGPIVPTMSDPTLQNLSITNLIDGIYTFSYEVGNPACGYEIDEVTIVVSSAPPTGVNAGTDESINCYDVDYQLSATPATDGFAQWSVSPSTGITISALDDPYATVSGLASGTTYTFTWTVTNGCGTANDDVVITVGSTQGENANAGPDECKSWNNSGNNETTLQATAPSLTGAVGTWTIISSTSPAGTISDVNDPNALFDGPGTDDISACLEWSVAVPGCQISRDTVYVSMYSISNGARNVNHYFCEGPGTYAVTPHEFLQWENLQYWDTVNYIGPSGVQFLTNADEQMASISFPAIGAYQFTIKTAPIDCGINSLVTVYIAESATPASAGPDQLLCDSYNVQLDADPATNGGYWSIQQTNNFTFFIPPSPAITVSDFSDPDAIVVLPDYGVYSAVWNSLADTTFSSTCIVGDTMEIIILPTADAGPVSKTFCALSSITLYGVSSFGYGTSSWSLFSGPSTPTQTLTANNGQTVVYDNFTAPGLYRFVYELNNTECGISTDTIDVIFLAPQPDAGLDFVACADSVWVMGSTTSTDLTAQWSLLEGFGIINGSSTQDSILINDLIAGDTLLLEYSWTTSTGCMGADTVQIIVDYIDQIGGVANNASGCDTSDGQIIITGGLANTAYDLYYLLDGTQQGPIAITTDVNGNYTMMGLSAGSYTEMYFENDSGCQSVETEFDILDACTAVVNCNETICLPINVEITRGLN